jgi:hypothetical protein
MAFNKGRSYGIQYILNGKPSYEQFEYLGNSGVYIVFYKRENLNSPPVSLVASKRKLSVDQIESDGDWAVGDLIDYNSENEENSNFNNGTSEEGNSEERRPYGRSFNGKNTMDPIANSQEGGKKSRKSRNQKKRKSRKQKQKQKKQKKNTRRR